MIERFIFLTLFLLISSCRVHEIDAKVSPKAYQSVFGRQFTGDGIDHLVDGLVLGDRTYYAGSFKQNIEIGGEQIQSVDNEDGLVVAMDKNFSPIWYKQFKGISEQQATIIFNDKKGDLYVAGYFKQELQVDEYYIQGASDGNRSTFVSKLDQSGKIIYIRAFVSDGDSFPLSVGPKNNGEIILTGLYVSAITIDGNHYDSAGVFDTFYMRIDQDGNVKNHFTVASTGLDYINKPFEDKDGNIFMGISYGASVVIDGKTFANTSGSMYGAIVKFDRNEKIIWSQVMESNGAFTLAKEFVEDGKGFIYTFGDFTGTATLDGKSITSLGGRDNFYTKIDSQTGKVIFLKSFGGTGNESSGNYLSYHDDNTIFFCTNSTSDLTIAGIDYPNQGNYDNTFVIFDSNGTIVNGVSFGSDGSDRLWHAYFEDEQFYLFGYLTGTATLFNRTITTNDRDPFLVRIKF